MTKAYRALYPDEHDEKMFNLIISGTEKTEEEAKSLIKKGIPLKWVSKITCFRIAHLKRLRDEGVPENTQK